MGSIPKKVNMEEWKQRIRDVVTRRIQSRSAAAPNLQLTFDQQLEIIEETKPENIGNVRLLSVHAIMPLSEEIEAALPKQGGRKRRQTRKKSRRHRSI